MTKIPTKRLALYIMTLGLLPLLLVTMDFHTQREKLLEREASIAQVRHLAFQKRQKQAQNTAVRAQYADTNALYLTHQLASLPLLQKEQRALEALFQNPVYTGNEPMEKRYAFLKQNRLSFHEAGIETGQGVMEASITLAKPVEIDQADLKELLARIEGEQSHKPHLVITDFVLKKREAVYDLSMKLLKREYP